jgi:RNA-binding protein Musashi
MDRRSYDRGDRNYGGSGNYNQNNTFNAPPQGMMNQQMYGGMSPAVMAQWYQNMRAYYAAMGRGMVPGMTMGTPIMGMPNMNMQGMTMGGVMPGQMMGMPQTMGGFQGGAMPMNQPFGAPNQPYQQQEMSAHEGEYTYDTAPDHQGHQSPPQSMSPEASSREGPPPNAPTGPSGGKPNYAGVARGGRGGMRGGGRGYSGGSFPGGMARGGNVRFNPYGR